MSRTNFLSVLFGIVFVGMLGGIAWYFILAIQEADANVKAGVIGILGVLLAAILTNFFTRRREINARHFLEKREAYGKIIDIVFDLIASIKSGKNLPEKTLVNKLLAFKKGLMVWGGPEVIESWNEFEIESERAGNSNDPEMLITVMERMLRAIRKDLGHDDHQLKFGSLIGLLILGKDKKKLLKNDK